MQSVSFNCWILRCTSTESLALILLHMRRENFSGNLRVGGTNDVAYAKYRKSCSVVVIQLYVYCAVYTAEVKERQMRYGRINADSHIACRSHVAPMPFPCHVVPLRVLNVSFPFDLHSVALSDSHLSCHAHAML